MNEQEIRAKIAAEIAAAANARSEKAGRERARAIERAETVSNDRIAKMAMDHAWALKNQAVGLWDAADVVRGDR